LFYLYQDKTPPPPSCFGARASSACGGIRSLRPNLLPPETKKKPISNISQLPHNNFIKNYCLADRNAKRYSAYVFACGRKPFALRVRVALKNICPLETKHTWISSHLFSFYIPQISLR
jgi:hypothetical protein